MNLFFDTSALAPQRQTSSAELVAGDRFGQNLNIAISFIRRLFNEDIEYGY